METYYNDYTGNNLPKMLIGYHFLHEWVPFWAELEAFLKLHLLHGRLLLVYNAIPN